VDAQLQAGLRAATARYAEEVAWTDQLAKDLADNAGVRGALAERDVQALELVTQTSASSPPGAGSAWGVYSRERSSAARPCSAPTVKCWAGSLRRFLSITR
jgi:hypothetical protein